MVDAKQIGADIDKFLENYGIISKECEELQDQIDAAFGERNITVIFCPPCDFGEHNEE